MATIMPATLTGSPRPMPLGLPRWDRRPLAAPGRDLARPPATPSRNGSANGSGESSRAVVLVAAVDLVVVQAVEEAVKRAAAVGARAVAVVVVVVVVIAGPDRNLPYHHLLLPPLERAAVRDISRESTPGTSKWCVFAYSIDSVARTVVAWRRGIIRRNGWNCPTPDRSWRKYWSVGQNFALRKKGIRRKMLPQRRLHVTVVDLRKLCRLPLLPPPPQMELLLKTTASRRYQAMHRRPSY